MAGIAALPYWVQLLQSLAVPAIALLAAVIGIMQWRTAHQRAVLDLFEKRWQVYSVVRSVIGYVVREGSAPTERAIAFLQATDKAQFIFGSEVNTYLREVYKLLIHHHLAEEMIQHRPDPERGQWIDRQAADFTEIVKFYETFDGLVKPYMRMHQKAPWI